MNYKMAEALDALNDVHAAHEFMDRIGMSPTDDAVEQLLEVFVPALRIMTDRPFNREAQTWRKAGWRGILTDIKKKADRLWQRSWVLGKFDEDSPLDLINYLGFYIRVRGIGEPWGDWGEPGNGGRHESQPGISQPTMPG